MYAGRVHITVQVGVQVSAFLVGSVRESLTVHTVLGTTPFLSLIEMETEDPVLSLPGK